VAEAILELPSGRDGESLADWAEALMFLEGRDEMPRTELRRRLRDDSSEADVEVSLLLEQVHFRSRRARSSYPFLRSEAGLQRRPQLDHTLYEFLLWLSIPQSPARKRHEYRTIDRYFDRVVLKALRAYLGSRSRGVRFATPASDDRPKSFGPAIEWLADQMNLVASGSIPPNPDKNDAGVDVIAWIPLRDARSDYLVAIAQCTLRDDWEEKAVAVSGAAGPWGGGWINLGKDPLTVLAVPFTFSDAHPRFDELRATVNLILDRGRICEVLSGPYAADVERLTRWSATVREMLLRPRPAPVRRAKPTPSGGP
jgi:hypothetical protein